MLVGFDEIKNRKIVFAVIKPGAAPDDLLEFDHGFDGAHQHDVADVARIHPRGQLLGRGQDGGNGLLVVPKVPQVLFT